MVIGYDLKYEDSVYSKALSCKVLDRFCQSAESDRRQVIHFSGKSRLSSIRARFECDRNVTWSSLKLLLKLDMCILMVAGLARLTINQSTDLTACNLVY